MKTNLLKKNPLQEQKRFPKRRLKRQKWVVQLVNIISGCNIVIEIYLLYQYRFKQSYKNVR